MKYINVFDQENFELKGIYQIGENITFENDKEKGTFIDLYQNARTREISRNWPQISLTLSDTLREILVNENDSQTILDKSAEKIESIGAENR